MSQEKWDDLYTRLTSRKFWAFIIAVISAFLYALGVIDDKGMAAITAAAATYQIGEGIADYTSNKNIITDADKTIVQTVIQQEVKKYLDGVRNAS